MGQASTAVKRATVLLALLFAALLGSAPVAALSTGHAVESAILELDLGQARGSLEQRAESGSLAPDAEGDGVPDDAIAVAPALDPVHHSRDEVGAAVASPHPPARLRSYQARAPPLG